MAILSKEDILKSIKERIGENTDDETIKFIEDISDTLNDYEAKNNDKTDWKTKYKENDEQWRKKYKERFFSAPAKDETENAITSDDDDTETNKLTYENLFKEETK